MVMQHDSHRCLLVVSQQSCAVADITAKCSPPASQARPSAPDLLMYLQKFRKQNITMQACVLEGKAFAELESGAESQDDLEACMLLTNSQGKELLAPGKGADQADNKKIILKLTDGQVLCSILMATPCQHWACTKDPGYKHAWFVAAKAAGFWHTYIMLQANIILAMDASRHRPCLHVQAELSMSVLGSSIALLSGQKPPFRCSPPSKPSFI